MAKGNNTTPFWTEDSKSRSPSMSKDIPPVKHSLSECIGPVISIVSLAVVAVVYGTVSSWWGWFPPPQLGLAHRTMVDVATNWKNDSHAASSPLGKRGCDANSRNQCRSVHCTDSGNCKQAPGLFVSARHSGKLCIEGAMRRLTPSILCAYLRGARPCASSLPPSRGRAVQPGCIMSHRMPWHNPVVQREF